MIPIKNYDVPPNPRLHRMADAVGEAARRYAVKPC
jgi:hypothetical protein